MTDQRATPQDYQHLFELSGSVGERVLTDLMRRFSTQSTYVKGGHEAERESCFRAGQRSVIERIINQINIANGVKDVSAESDE